MENTRISPLDGLRGFAVLVVFACHTIGYPERGDLGVDIFFVLSGFLISSQLYGEVDRSGSINLLKFYWKRAARLLPAFVAMCIMYVVIAWQFPASAPSVPLGTLLGLIITSNYHWVNGTPVAPLLQHTWSLALEWQFYFVWPVLLLIIARAGALKWLLPALVVAGLTAAATQWAGVNYLNFGGFIIGAIVAMPRTFTVAPPRLLYLFSGLAIAGLIFVPFQDRTYSNLAATISTALLIFAITSSAGDAKWPVLDSAILKHFGKISYGLYLYHFPIAALMFVQGYSRPEMLVGGLLISIPLAELSWPVEARIMKWRPAILFTPAPSPAE